MTYQTKSNNRYELPLLESNSKYTLRYEGSANQVTLGGLATSIENNCLVQSGSANKVALFNDEVSNVMLIKNDVREQTIPYFRGLLSTQMPVLMTRNNLNLLDTNPNSWISTTNAVETKHNIIVFPNKVYSFHNVSGAWVDIVAYNDSGDEISKIVSINGAIGTTKTVFTTPNDCASLKVILKLTTETTEPDRLKLRLFESETDLGYPPYSEVYKSNILSCNEEVALHSIGDVCDTLDCKTGQLTRHIKEVDLLCDNWQNQGDYENNYVYKYQLDSVVKYGEIICNRMNIHPLDWNFKKEGVYVYGNHILIALDKNNNSNASTLEQFKEEWIKNNPLKIQYILANPTVETVDLSIVDQDNQPLEQMNYLTDYYGEIKSNGTLPRLTYKLQSTNTFAVEQLKPNTLYTMYSEGEATVATLGGKASILLQNPQTVTSGSVNKSLTFDSAVSRVILIESDVRNQVIPYFTGTLDVINPIVKTTSGSKTNTVNTNVRLRSVGNVRDTYDLKTGILTKRISDNYTVLDSPQTQTISVAKPISYNGAIVELSSNTTSLLPYFEYSCKSPNYYQAPIESGEIYTVKFTKTSNGTLTMGGVTANTTGNQVITTKNSDVKAILFSGDLGISDLMIMKTDVRNVPTPYFRGLKDVVNPTITVSNGNRTSNSVSITATMRSLPNGTKDELNLVTGEFVQRVGQRNYEDGDSNGPSMITDGITTLYQLPIVKRSNLSLSWSNGVLTAYDGSTIITSEAQLLKPHLYFRIPTSTLEELVSILEEKNANLASQMVDLEVENLMTMVALAEVYETMMKVPMATSSTVSNTKDILMTPMVGVYAKLVTAGVKTIDEVPEHLQINVTKLLKK
jgi:hypothetical protein